MTLTRATLHFDGTWNNIAEIRVLSETMKPYDALCILYGISSSQDLLSPFVSSLEASASTTAFFINTPFYLH